MASDLLKLQVLLGVNDQVSGPAGRISRSAQQTLGNIKALSKQLNQLKDIAGDVGKFRELKRGLPDTAREAKQTRARLKALQEQFDATTEPSKKLARQLKAAGTAASKATGKFRKQTDQVRELRTRLTAAGVSTRTLRRDETTLANGIKRTTDAIKQQHIQLDKLGKKQQRVAAMRERFQKSQEAAANMSVGGLAAMSAGRAILRPVIGAVTHGAQFQSRLRDQAITGDMSGEQEKHLGKLTRGLSRRWGIATAQMFDASETLIAAGVSDKASLNQYLPLLAKVHVATNGRMEDLGQLFVSLRQNLDVKDMAGSLDALAKSGKEGNFELKDMAKWMPQLGPVMANLGEHGKKAVVTLGAALQVARMGAGDADTAGNNLKNFLAKITAPQTQANFQKVGIDLNARLHEFQQQGIGPMEGTLRVIKSYLASQGGLGQLQAAANIKDQEQQTAALDKLGKSFKLSGLFQDQQALAAILPLLAHTNRFQQIRESSANAKGTVDTDAGKRMATLSKTWDKAKSNALDLALIVSNILSPSVTALLKWLTDLAKHIGAWAKEHPTLTAAIVKTAAVLGVLLTVLGGLAIGIAGLLSPFALLQFSIGRTVMAVGSLKDGWKFLRKDATRAGQHIAQLSRKSMTLAKNLGGGLLRGASKATRILAAFGKVAGSGALKALLKLVGGFKLIVRVIAWAGRLLLTNPILLLLGLVALAAYLIWKNWEPIKAFFVDLWDGIMKALQPVIDWLVKAWKWVAALFVAGWNRNVKQFTALWSGIKAFWGALWGGIKAVVGVIMDWISAGWDRNVQALTRAWSIFKSFWSSLWDGLKAACKAVIDWVLGKIQWVIDKWKGVKETILDIGNNDSKQTTRAMRHAADLVSNQHASAKARTAGGLMFTALAGMSILTGQAGALVSAMHKERAAPVRVQAPRASTSHTNITVNAAPGMDERKLGEEVRKQLDERDRQQAAKRQSRLGDLD